MNSDLQDRIYKAQSFGNVEPIEFMVPYPNLFSLVEGQNVKFKNSLLFKDIQITNEDFINLVNRAASWIKINGGKPESRIFLPTLPFPYSEIMAFGIWLLGGIIVIAEDGLFPKDSGIGILNIIPNDIHFESELAKMESDFTPTFKPNLLDEALIYWGKGNGIKLSHYNLLVTTYGVQKALNLQRGSTIKVNLQPNTPAWVVFELILPLFTGTELTDDEPDKTFGLPGQFDNSDYIIQQNWNSIEITDPPSIYLLPENGGILSINAEPIHLTKYKLNNGKLILNGHSVMMGYIDEEKNENCFINDSFILEYFPN